MNPAIVIPTYWSSNPVCGLPGESDCYDHTTQIGTSTPELDSCLESLLQVKGLGRVILLLVCPAHDEPAARAEVEAIMARYPSIDTILIDDAFAHELQNTVEEAGIDLMGETVSLRGYGAIRNMGLAVCAILGHDVAVFLDDDEVVTEPDFLIKAVYGLGHMTRREIPILAKSGFFYDRRNSYRAPARESKWYDKFWAKREEFNEYMDEKMRGPRISRANVANGGIMSIHAEAFMRIAFDPWITRGEDQDIVFNFRLYGLDFWFDNKWHVKHLPPPIKSSAPRFLQDVYRWLYQFRKLEFANAKIDLNQVTPRALMPYPGNWMLPNIKQRIFWTTLARTLGTGEKNEYFAILTRGRKQAMEYADRNCEHYLDFQKNWSELMHMLWGHSRLGDILMGVEADDVTADVPHSDYLDAQNIY